MHHADPDATVPDMRAIPMGPLPRCPWSLVALLLAMTSPVVALASPPDDVRAAPAAREGSGDMAPGRWSETVTPPASDPGQATTRVTREELELRQPRSAPDALRYEPGVFVQQTAQSQGSPFVRGRTGQQTVLLFDHVRMNNSLFRQGPNQYFFTIDARTIDHIDVLRGSASTRYGSDAIGGVLHAVPVDPTLDPDTEGVAVRPRASMRYATADNEIGGRLSLDAQVGPRFGVLAGAGYRTTDLLESGGAVYNPSDGELPEVPRFAEDGRTQLGTGFDELTADVRTVVRVTPELRLISAWYEYRQYDAPRTDQCPAAYAPFDECLQYDEQFRTVAYAALEGDAGPAAHYLRATLSYQRQHERRTAVRPSSFTINGGRDDAHTLGGAVHARTDTFRLTDRVQALIRWGGDIYHDRVDTLAWLQFTDLDVTRIRSRGQYIDGSTYTWGGLFAELETRLRERWILRGGARLTHAAANAPADPESGTLPVDKAWTTAVGNVGAEWWASRRVTLLANVDQGYRAPNLDDLTSRQQTGPGFQFENAALVPEHGVSLELGVRADTPRVRVEAWAYRATLRDAIARSSRNTDDCPPDTPQCGSSWSRFQLVNLDGVATIHGAEGSVLLRLPHHVTVAANISWAIGSSPNPEERTATSESYEERVPLSRIPPLNGTVEALWRDTSGVHIGAALRWATLQDRLAVSDVSDARIPFGGTPGFAVLDARAGYRWRDHIVASLVVENLTDAAYRYHGSSVNGPGRGIILSLEAGL